LPHLYHPDEWALIMPALRILQTGDLNPHRFEYGSLHIYVLAVLYSIYYVYGRAQGRFVSIQDIPVYDSTHGLYEYELPEVYLLSRSLTALLGAATVVALYVAGRRLFDRRTGLVAALLLTFLPLHVVNSHYTTTDVPATFLIVVGFLFIISVFYRGTRRDYILAGILIGLATGAKYPGGLLIVSLVAAHLGRDRTAFEGSKLLIGLLAATAAFVLSTPFAVLDYQNWRFWLSYVSDTYSLNGTMHEGSSARWYARFLLQSPYLLTTILAVIGLIWLGRRNWRQGLLIGSFPITYFLAIAQYERRYPRALIPLLPFLALLAAVLIVHLTRVLSQHSRGSPRKANALLVALSLAVIALPLLASLGHTYRFTQKELRTLGREWIVANIPEGSSIATDAAAPVLPPGRYQVDRIGWSIVAHDVAWYREQGYEYVVVSENLRNSPNRTLEVEADYQTFLNDDHLSLIAEIEGPLFSYPGFHLWIYRASQEF
ncbi:MAG: ArnT family glycosyltransferase, partial [Anaerolineae bacterium]